MTQYACCYVEHEGSILLIEKKKPAWQLGLFNLPGGHVEDGETAAECAVRELFEEAHLQAIEAIPLGRITGDAWDVYVVRCVTPHPDRLHQKTSERVFWASVRQAMRADRLIPNLRLIIPLCHYGICGWVIDETVKGKHTVQFPCEFQLI